MSIINLFKTVFKIKRKYEFTKSITQWNGRTLHRIKALRDFGNVKKGDLGGWIEKESNLSQDDNCWIYDNGRVCDNAKVYGNAQVCNYSIIYNNAKVYDNAYITNHVNILDNAKVYGNAKIYDKVKIYDNAKVFDNALILDKVLISGNTLIYGKAEVYSNSYISNNIEVYGNAIISGNMILRQDAKISNNEQVKSIDNFRYPITITKDFIFIECQDFTPNWLDKSDEEIYEEFKGCVNNIDEITTMKIAIKEKYNILLKSEV